MVLFKLSTLRPLITDATVKRMFFLPASMDLDLYSHVVLTTQGPLVADRDTSRLIAPGSETVFLEGAPEVSLYQRFSDRFDLFPADEADCLAIGQLFPFPPVLLHLQIESAYGEAKAVFAEEPPGEHYELLKAVGVEYLGGSQEGPYFVARFRNHLPTHVQAGEIARFTRTNHCNLFFLRHGSIDEELERGLIQASTGRVAWAAIQAREAVARLASEACDKEPALAHQLPPPAKAFAFGDAVPLGFMLKALSYVNSPASIFSNIEIRKKLTSRLRHERQGLLWPIHASGMATSTGSALVLQGFYNPEGVEALEVFADGRGGYYPQLCANEEEPGKVVVDSSERHRCQPDFATACLVRASRNEAGLDTKTSVEYLVSRFETRSGLHFANPYLTDWAFASALAKDDSARELRQRLADEILASINDDYSFGLFDVAMSSSFAILSLAALGYRGRSLRIVQLRLLDFMQPDGTFPSGTPFYSTLEVKREHVPGGVAARVPRGKRQTSQADRAFHEVSYYFDSHGMISTAVATLALLAECSPADRDSESIEKWQNEAHPRYRCRDHIEYVQEFALPPYLDGS